MTGILQAEMVRTMKLLGVRSLEELEPKHVKILQRMAPNEKQEA